MTDIPSTAKKPADKKAKKAEAPKTVTATVRDIDWVIPIEALDDFELIDAFAQMEEGDEAAVTRIPFVLRRLLGDQWKRAMGVLRDPETGRVTIEDGSTFVGELVQELQNPNS